jgi:predicted alpha-1,2-mannosidase
MIATPKPLRSSSKTGNWIVLALVGNALRKAAALLLAVPLCITAFAQTVNLYDQVDPFIGTGGGGLTSPAASLPFGMIQWGPATNQRGYYVWEDTATTGFSLTHLDGVGCPVGSDVPVLPWSQEPQKSPGETGNPYVEFAQGFDHAQEEAHPGYYVVALANGTRVELTVADRAGIARFTFPPGVKAALLVNTGGSADTNVHMQGVPAYAREHNENQVELLGDEALTGFTTSWGFCTSPAHYTLYIAAKFDQPYQHFDTWRNNEIQKNQRVSRGKRSGAWLDFGDRRQVQMKIGISYVSEAGALANLNSELPGWDFEAVHSHARDIWTKLLDRITVEGGTPNQDKIFATALYHSLLTPTLFSDHNGDYIGFDWKTHSLTGSKQTAQYANYSDWDIYRNTVQLQALLAPDIVSDMMQSLVDDSVQGGIVPRWPLANQSTYEMAGDSSNILWASGYAFGARAFDAKTALHYMIKGGTQPQKDADTFLYSHYYTDAERTFLPQYLKLGYVPAMEDPVSVSRTLEYANDDFSIAQLAKDLDDTKTYQHFMAQSQNWKNLFDPQTKWMRPRLADGTWLQHFDVWLALPKQNTWGISGFQYGFEEGNTTQWSFMVPFDYPQEFAAMGGDDKVVARLDRFFCKEPAPISAPCFTAANEHNFVTPYAYVFAGEPWKTQEVIPQILETAFKPTPNGLPGNDDLGATSGLYVWNALGFYPAVPGIGGVVLGTPMFKKAVLYLGDGRTLAVERAGSGFYVQNVLLNGAPYSGSWLPLSSLQQGTTDLQFTLGPKPNMERGKPQADRPPSFRQP